MPQAPETPPPQTGLTQSIDATGQSAAYWQKMDQIVSQAVSSLHLETRSATKKTGRSVTLTGVELARHNVEIDTVEGHPSDVSKLLSALRRHTDDDASSAVSSISDSSLDRLSDTVHERSPTERAARRATARRARTVTRTQASTSREEHLDDVPATSQQAEEHVRIPSPTDDGPTELPSTAYQNEDIDDDEPVIYLDALEFPEGTTRPVTPSALPATPPARPVTPSALPATPPARPATPPARPATPPAHPATPPARAVNPSVQSSEQITSFPPPSDYSLVNFSLAVITEPSIFSREAKEGMKRRRLNDFQDIPHIPPSYPYNRLRVGRSPTTGLPCAIDRSYGWGSSAYKTFKDGHGWKVKFWQGENRGPPMIRCGKPVAMRPPGPIVSVRR